MDLLVEYVVQDNIVLKNQKDLHHVLSVDFHHPLQKLFVIYVLLDPIVLQQIQQILSQQGLDTLLL